MRVCLKIDAGHKNYGKCGCFMVHFKKSIGYLNLLNSCMKTSSLFFACFSREFFWEIPNISPTRHLSLKGHVGQNANPFAFHELSMYPWKIVGLFRWLHFLSFPYEMVPFPLFMDILDILFIFQGGCFLYKLGNPTGWATIRCLDLDQNDKMFHQNLPDFEVKFVMRWATAGAPMMSTCPNVAWQAEKLVLLVDSCRW